MSELEERLHNALKNTENTLVTNAFKEFNESMKSLNESKARPDQSYDPRDLDSQISSYQVSILRCHLTGYDTNGSKDLFDRLKFLFLEQEAKEKFLRMVLEPNPRNIDKSDITKATEERDEMFKQVQSKEKELEDLTTRIKEIATDNYNKHVEIKEIEKRLIEKIESLKTKREQLAKTKLNLENFQKSDPSLSKFQELFQKIPSLIQNVDESVLNSIEEMQKIIDQHLSKIHDLQQQLLNSEYALGKEQERIQSEKIKLAELTKQDEELSKQVELIKQSLNNEDSNNPETLKMNKREESLRIMMKVWLQISNIYDFIYNDENGLIKFKFKDFPTKECLINIDEINGKIVKLRYDDIEDNLLQSIMMSSNKADDPVSHAVQSLYKQLGIRRYNE